MPQLKIVIKGIHFCDKCSQFTHHTLLYKTARKPHLIGFPSFIILPTHFLKNLDFLKGKIRDQELMRGGSVCIQLYQQCDHYNLNVCQTLCSEQGDRTCRTEQGTTGSPKG